MKFLKYLAVALTAIILLSILLFGKQLYQVYALSTVQPVSAIDSLELSAFNAQNGIHYHGRITPDKVEDVFSEATMPKTYLFNAKGQYMFKLGCFSSAQSAMQQVCTPVQQSIGGSNDSLQVILQNLTGSGHEKATIEISSADYYVLNLGATWMQELGVYHQQLIMDQIENMSDSVKIQFININIDIDPSWGIDISELLHRSETPIN